MSRAFSIVAAPQGSPEWFKARAGRLTGSRAADMLATIKSGEAAARRDLRTQLVVERMTGEPMDDGALSYLPDIRRGENLEPAARAAYEALTGNVVRQTGFLAHNTLPVGCSLDGDVDDFTGIVEIKCPRPATHLAYIQAAGLPSKYKAQVLHNLWITGAQWADFISYAPQFPPHLRLFRYRVDRNEFDTMAYARTVEKFLAEVQTEYDNVIALPEVAVNG